MKWTERTKMRLLIVSTLILVLSLGISLGVRDGDLNAGNAYDLDKRCADAIESQVHDELHASLAYMNMAAHFGQNKIGRQGFYKYFRHHSDEEKQHAQKLIDYLNRRGSQKKLFDVSMPNKYEWVSGLEALRDALSLEHIVNNKLVRLHGTADKVCNDPHLTHFLEEKFLEEQVESIDELNRYIAELAAMDSGLGEFFMDKKLSDETEDYCGK